MALHICKGHECVVIHESRNRTIECPVCEEIKALEDAAKDLTRRLRESEEEANALYKGIREQGNG